MYLTNLFLFVLVAYNAKSEDIYIGAIFDEDETQEKAFRFAVDKLNEERTAETNGESLIINIVEHIPPQSPFQAMKTACTFMGSGLIAIFGPRSRENIDSVQSVCDEKEVPHIVTRWNHRPLRSGTLVNMYPHTTTLTQVYMAILKELGWQEFTILYEDDESLIRLSEFMKLAKEDGLTVDIAQLDKKATGIYRDTLKEVQLTEQKFFVIDCHIDRLKEVLLHAQQVGMMTHEYNYFLTNLDTHTEDLTDFQYSSTQIIGIRLVNIDRKYVQDLADELYAEQRGMLLSHPAWLLRSETALLIDAVSMFFNALKEIENAKPLVTSNLQCNSSESWEHGYSVVNLMKTSTYTGLTGLIKFNNEGFRSEIELDIIELKEGGITKIGYYNHTEGVNISRGTDEKVEEGADSMKNKTFIVSTALVDPYAMLKETHKTLSGNERFEGFGIDIIHELSLIEGFNYTFIIREDKSYGNRDDNGNWNGMIGDILNGDADLAIVDLTITSERASAVDFTSPFMNLGISILFRKPEKAPPEFFSFAEPFAIDTWGMLALAFFAVSFSLFIMGRLSQEEWTNPYPCIEEPEFLINQFSLSNSIWFATGSLMQQGSEIAPIAVSTRMVAGVWWFFILIMVASYTANLAAFLATENPINLFTDVASLVENAEKHELRYGAKIGGATAKFFKGSNNSIYQKIAQHMEDHPEDMVKDNQDGVILAKEQKYALFMESSSIEYVTQRECDLQMYGKNLDEKGYGIAMRKNSPYRQRLILAVLQLQSSGVLDALRRKWWEERRGGGQCQADAEASDATPLDLVNVEGVFYVTIYGLIISIILVILEYMGSILKTSRRAKISFLDAFKADFKHYLNFDSSVKPVLYADSDSDSKSKTRSKSKSKSKSGSLKENTDSHHTHDTNGIIKPAPYGFRMSSKDSSQI